MNVTIRCGDKFYVANVTVDWATIHNNYAMVSCGLTVGEDLTKQSFDWLMRRGRLTEITRDEWNHKGCQSACIKRGDKECRW